MMRWLASSSVLLVVALASPSAAYEELPEKPKTVDLEAIAKRRARPLGQHAQARKMDATPTT